MAKKKPSMLLAFFSDLDAQVQAVPMTDMVALAPNNSVASDDEVLGTVPVELRAIFTLFKLASREILELTEQGQAAIDATVDQQQKDARFIAWTAKINSMQRRQELLKVTFWTLLRQVLSLSEDKSLSLARDWQVIVEKQCDCPICTGRRRVTVVSMDDLLQGISSGAAELEAMLADALAGGRRSRPRA